MKKIYTLFSFLIVCSFFNINSNAQPGANDPTFNSTDSGYGNGDGFYGTVRSIAVQLDGKIIVGGEFISFNGITVNKITRLNIDGSLDNTFFPGSGFNNTVRAIAIQSDGKIIVGGDFTSFNGTPKNRIARLNNNGTLDTLFNPGFNNIVRSITIQNDGKIIVGGDFVTFTTSYVVRLNDNGTTDYTFTSGSGFDNNIYSTAIQNDGKVVLGGIFTTFFGNSRNGIVRLNANGSIDTTFNPGTGFLNGWVLSLAIQSDGKIMIGGGFNSFNGILRNGLVRLNTNGTLDSSFDPSGPGLDATAWSVAIQPDNKIMVGGMFTSYNSISRNRIARLNADGSLDLSFDPGTGFVNYVYSQVILNDGKMIVGGALTNFNGVERNKIAGLNANGSLNVLFNSGSGFNNANYSTSIQSDGKIIVGGAFTMFNGAARIRIVRLKGDGTLDSTFNPGTGFDNYVFSTAIQNDGKIITGGDFTSFNGNAVFKIARLNSDGTLDTLFTTGTGFNNSVLSSQYNLMGK